MRSTGWNASPAGSARSTWCSSTRPARARLRRVCGHQPLARFPDGQLYVSTNLHRLSWSAFLEHVTQGLEAAGRRGLIDTRTLPLDHRSGPGDPPYLKAAWIHLDG